MPDSKKHITSDLGGGGAAADQSSMPQGEAQLPFFQVSPSSSPVSVEGNTLTLGDLQGNLAYLMDVLLSGDDPVLEIVGVTQAEKNQVLERMKRSIATIMSDSCKLDEVSASLVSFRSILTRYIRVNPDKQLRLIGDVLCDRVGHDAFTLCTLHVLREKGLRIKETFSNHFHKIAPYLATSGTAEFKTKHKQYQSGMRLQRDIDSGVITWKDDLAPWVQSYIKGIVLVDVVRIEGVDKKSPQFRMYSHAPVGYTTLIALCLKLGVKPDLSPENILATVDSLNQAFQDRIQQCLKDSPELDPFVGIPYADVKEIIGSVGKNSVDIACPELRVAYLRGNMPSVVPDGEGGYVVTGVQEHFAEVSALKQAMHGVMSQLTALKDASKLNSQLKEALEPKIEALHAQHDALFDEYLRHMGREMKEQGADVRIEPHDPKIPVIAEFIHGHEAATVPPALAKKLLSEMQSILDEVGDDVSMDEGMVALQGWCQDKGCHATDQLFTRIKANLRDDQWFDPSDWKEKVMHALVAPMSLYGHLGVSSQHHVPDGVQVINLDHDSRGVRDYGVEQAFQAGVVCRLPEASFKLEKSHLNGILSGVLVLEQLKQLELLLGSHDELLSCCQEFLANDCFTDAYAVDAAIKLRNKILGLKELKGKITFHEKPWEHAQEVFLDDKYDALKSKSAGDIRTVCLAEVQRWRIYEDFERGCAKQASSDQASLGGGAAF